MSGKRFRTALRGYDRAEVDAFLEHLERHGVEDPATLVNHQFHTTMPGYDREQVDVYLDALAAGPKPA